jgi:hypothetical protein
VDVKHNKCEDCKVKVASFGRSLEGKARWCPSCAKTEGENGAQSRAGGGPKEREEVAQEEPDPALESDEQVARRGTRARRK